MSPSPYSMLLRGFAKVMFIAFAVNEVLTAAFSVVARQIDLDLAQQSLTLFSYVTCILVSFWLQSDARRAFGFARDKGFVKQTDNPPQALQIAQDCPKRWLVVLHSELNPAVAVSR